MKEWDGIAMEKELKKWSHSISKFREKENLP
jgi:hypothetical protein